MFTSSGSSMLAMGTNGTPSSVLDSSRAVFWRSFRYFSYFSFLPMNSRRTAWGGLTMTSPSVPSTMMKSPFFTWRVMLWRPTTAGMPRERARMAVWDVWPPMSRATARTFSRLRLMAASEGRSSWATRTLSLSGTSFFSFFHLQVPVDLGQDVGDVRLPLLEILVVDGLEDLFVPGIDPGEGPFGPDLVLADDLLQAGKERGILEDQEVGLEDDRVLLAHLVLDVRLDPDEFALRALDRPPQPFQLIVHLAGGDGLPPRGENHPLGEGHLAHADPR